MVRAHASRSAKLPSAGEAAAGRALDDERYCRRHL
jgi:hypothetical protein